jgi:DNA-binding NtrC family response regulator
MTKEQVAQAIEDACGNRRLASARLGITERHLYRLLKKYNLK